jgi:cephalosporin-C deacetylase-like acetyl esterase
VLYPLGHEAGAKAYPVWQQMLVTLARRGYVCLTWDPLGQGERIQTWDADLKDSKFRASTLEHTELNVQCMLTGNHVAQYTIWDGLRALDYLTSRKEVDANRIGCSGNSGGGTHTTYLSALDDRIRVAAPSCYTNSWSRMLESLGPQDGEQVFPYWLQHGLDYPDFIYGFGPKPFLVLSAIRDFFPIMGARETFAELESVYSRLGLREKIAMVEADDGHGFSAPRRKAAYEWFGRWLKGSPDYEGETEIRPELPGDLDCTKTGQVATSFDADDVFTINRRHAMTLVAARAGGSGAVARARDLTGFAPKKGALSVLAYGTLLRQGYRIEKLTYESEPGILIPALLYVPDGGPARKAAVLVLDGAGKSASGDAQEKLARAGLVVLSIDARGLGETRSTMDGSRNDFMRFFGDHDSGMTAILMGKTLAGMRAEDVVRGIDYLATHPGVDAARISGYGKGGGAVPVLYAATFDARLKAAVLENMLASYQSVVEHRIHSQVFEQIVPGALKAFDLPDLIATLAPRPVWLINTADPLGNRMRAAEVKSAQRSPGPSLQVRESHSAEALGGVADALLRP